MIVQLLVTIEINGTAKKVKISIIDEDQLVAQNEASLSKFRNEKM